MSEVPKIVYDRLRTAEMQRAVVEPAHPEADLLTAFAEQTLSVTERDSVLAHLALCGDCREVVALALPAADFAATPSVTLVVAADERVQGTRTRVSAPHGLRFAWPSLRWAALAAGIAVVGAVLLLRPGKLNQPQTASVNSQVATAAIPPPPATQIGSSAAALQASQPGGVPPPQAILASTGEHATQPRQSSADQQLGVNAAAQAQNQMVAPSINTPSMNRSLAQDRMSGTQLNSQAPLSKKLESVRPEAPAQVESGALVAADKIPNSGDYNYNLKDSRSGSTLPAKEATETLPTTARSLDNDASAVHGVNETVEVSAASPMVAIATSDEKVLARSARPVEKAKQATGETDTTAQNEIDAQPKGETGAAVGALRTQGRVVTAATKLTPAANQPLAAHISWQISAGILRRSSDGGQSWQSSLHADHPLLCYAIHDQEVWTGGQAGTLFHSIDSGVTWAPVQLSTEGRILAFDIVRIDVTGPSQIVVSTGNSEVWRSIDGGKTWEKK